VDLGVRDSRYLIVGGTAGMGLAAAQVLAADGARVVIAGRDAERADAAVEHIASPLVTAVVGDVSREGEAERLVAGAAVALGGLDGIAVTTGTGRAAHSSLGDASDAMWAETFDDVLMGTVRSVRAALPHLVSAGGGTVVTTAAY
jgi:3-oxoacyl-[acyl-carrier protein] reductase